MHSIRVYNYVPDEFWSLIFVVANGTQTIAVPKGNGEYRLYGYKWFTSATDADIALTLAREQDDKGDAIPVWVFIHI